MKKIIPILVHIFGVFFISQIFYFLLTPVALADTHLNGLIDVDTTLTANNNPYYLDHSVEVVPGVTLSIEPGVYITSTTSGSLFVDNSKIIIKGEINDPVKMDHIVSIFGRNAELNIKNLSEESLFGLDLVNSNANIDSAVFKSNIYGLKISNSVVDVEHSKFSGNVDSAIYVASPNSLGKSQINIHNSSIYNNYNGAINNTESVLVHAENNWWGTSTPNTTEENKITGNVSYSPWQSEEGQTVNSSCCSSVLFLPGLEGSTLLKPDKNVFGYADTNTLWPPNRNKDVETLYLDKYGKTIDQKIYSDKPIDWAFSLFPVYRSFMNSLDSLVTKGIIQEWKAYGYDWRKPIDQVVTGLEQKATTTESLVSIVQEMARGSKTGKVSIVAHSNGGLVAKYLVKVLQDSGQANLIDSFISVAVPYLGTPMAIAALLHGDGQSIAGGLILSQLNARNLGLNMSSAYSLLPSSQYFLNAIGPTIVFASTSVRSLSNNHYGQYINNASDQTAFIADSFKDRKKSNSKDVNQPLIGSANLLAAATVMHDILDPLTWPANIMRYAIIGLNRSTTNAITYSSLNSHTASTTLNGDGTVIADSAAYNSGQIFSADLPRLRPNINISHANILEAPGIQWLISKLLEKTGDKNSLTNSEQSSEMPQGISVGLNRPETYSYVVLSTHSPVELHVYDKDGHHVGLKPKPAGLDVEDGLYTFFDADITGSDFRANTYSEGDRETYITLPDTGEPLSVVIKGIGFGTFNYNIEHYSYEGAALGNAYYNSIPVTPLTEAKMTLKLNSVTKENAPKLLSVIEPLQVDEHGTGVADIYVTASSTQVDNVDPDAQIESLRALILSIGDQNSAVVKKMLSKLDKISSDNSKNKTKRRIEFSEQIQRKIGHYKAATISNRDKKDILDALSKFVAQYQ